MPWVNGTSLLIEPWISGATVTLYCGLHEREDMAFVLHLLRESVTFAGIGANIGTSSFQTSDAVGSRTLL